MSLDNLAARRLLIVRRKSSLSNARWYGRVRDTTRARASGTHSWEQGQA